MDGERRQRARETPDRRRAIGGDGAPRGYAAVALILLIVLALTWASLA